MGKKEKVTSFLHKQDNGDKPSCRIMLQRSNMKWVQLLGYLIMEEFIIRIKIIKFEFVCVWSSRLWYDIKKSIQYIQNFKLLNKFLYINF